MEAPENQFVQLATMVGGVRKVNQHGYVPPQGIFVEFRLLEGNGETIKGMTAMLGCMGPWNKSQTVFVVVEAGKQQAYFVEEIGCWREIVNSKQFTPSMREYLTVRKPKNY